VVRGAAANGLEGEKNNTIKTRKCRRHYGTSYSAEFSARKHKESDSYIDSYDGIKRVSKQMSWLLATGQDLPTSKEIHAKGSFTADFWAREKREAELILFASDSPKAPVRSDDKVSHTTIQAAIAETFADFNTGCAQDYHIDR